MSRMRKWLAVGTGSPSDPYSGQALFHLYCPEIIPHTCSDHSPYSSPFPTPLGAHRVESTKANYEIYHDASHDLNTSANSCISKSG